MFKNEVWGCPMSLILCEGYTDDEATTQKTGKEIRADTVNSEKYPNPEK